MALIPAHRRGGAIVGARSVLDNVALSARGRFGLRMARAERRLAGQYVTALDVRPPNLRALVGTLSGGNQQKVALARSFESPAGGDPPLEEPTQGIDVNAKAEIRNLILQLAHDDGLAVVGRRRSPRNCSASPT